MTGGWDLYAGLGGQAGTVAGREYILKAPAGSFAPAANARLLTHRLNSVYGRPYLIVDPGGRSSNNTHRFIHLSRKGEL